jgi:hypothetical protein
MTQTYTDLMLDIFPDRVTAMGSALQIEQERVMVGSPPPPFMKQGCISHTPFMHAMLAFIPPGITLTGIAAATGSSRLLATRDVCYVSCDMWKHRPGLPV